MSAELHTQEANHRKKGGDDDDDEDAEHFARAAEEFVRHAEKKYTAIDVMVHSAEKPIHAAEAALKSLKHRIMAETQSLRVIRENLRELVDFGSLLHDLCTGEEVVILTKEWHTFIPLVERAGINVDISEVEIVTQLCSRYTVSKDCSVEEVGWNRDCNLRWKIDGHPSVELDRYSLSPAARKIDPYECDEGPITYDGDHHGVWAYTQISASAAIVSISPTQEIYVTLDPSLQSDSGRPVLVFANTMSAEDAADVSFILQHPSRRWVAAYDGLVYEHGTLRYGHLADVEGKGPGYAYWSWDDLAWLHRRHVANTWRNLVDRTEAGLCADEEPPSPAESE